jgi:hypothetical protein
MSNIRNCNNCTKCCEGYLKGKVNGKKFYPGQPCFFSILNSGCSIYEDRPAKPCKTYSCLWVTNIEIPEWLKPSVANILIDKMVENGIEYLRLLEAGSKISDEALSWAKSYSENNNLNLLWQSDDKMLWTGTEKFISMMEKKHYHES